jgi:hypothetical protein
MRVPLTFDRASGHEREANDSEGTECESPHGLCREDSIVLAFGSELQPQTELQIARRSDRGRLYVLLAGWPAGWGNSRGSSGFVESPETADGGAR